MNTSNGRTIKEVSKALNIGMTTLKSWESFFSLPVSRNEKNHRLYSDIIIKKFELIKKLSSDGLSLKEIKNQLEQSSDDRQTIEIINDTFDGRQEQNYNLIVKPYESKINYFKNLSDKVISENKELIRENATFKERLKNKEEIINFLQTKKHKWWNLFFK